MIWVNFKIYQESFGEGGLKLARICRRVEEKTKVKIIPVVSSLDLWRIKKEVGGEVWLQHVDLFFEGRGTGWVSPLQAMILGGGGTLLNHAEHKIPPGKIRQILAYLKRDQWVEHWKKEVEIVSDKISRFKTMVCFRTKGQARQWVRKLKGLADFVAYEPPELIGGEISVSQAQPEVIERIVKILPRQKVIVGAGIKSQTDVKRALQLGAKGVLVSSAVVKAKDPEEKLLELSEGFSK